MSNSDLSWFHCGRCGALFQAPINNEKEENHLCPKCGKDPNPHILEYSTKTAPPPPASPVFHSKHKKHAKRQRQPIVMLIFGWVLFASLIIGIVEGLSWYNEIDRGYPAPKIEASTSTSTPISQEDIALMEDARKHCPQVFFNFLKASTPEEIQPHIFSPTTNTFRLDSYYHLNPQLSLGENLIPASIYPLRIPGENAVEILWTNQNKERFDAAFRKNPENGEWKLDWQHFVRYSDAPWALFLAGGNDAEGEFRLLARERIVDSRQDKDKTISLTLYSPRIGLPFEYGYASPEFIVPRDSLDGQLLTAAFRQAREKKHIFGSVLNDDNPDGLIRVYLRIKRITVDKRPTFEISSVLACHWYETENPGIEVANSFTPEKIPERK